MIGVFDSGYGGLYILENIIKKMPEYNYVYLGDNARAPYGPHSKETIIKYSRQAVDFLFEKGARLIIIACFTASSLALKTLQEEYIRKQKIKDKNILGILHPVIEKAAELSKNFNVGVIGTRGTIDSNAFQIEIKKLNNRIKVCQKACPLLVPLIEEGWHKTPEAKMILKKYLRSLKSCNIDVLTLGCTHYPYMITDVKRILGKRINVLDPGKIEAQSLYDYLDRHPDIKNLLGKGGKREFFATENPNKFIEFGKNFTKLNIKKATKIDLERTKK